MLNLIKNEWMKIFRRTGTYVMIGLLVLIVTVTGVFIKYQEQGISVPDNENWEARAANGKCKPSEAT